MADNVGFYFVTQNPTCAKPPRIRIHLKIQSLAIKHCLERGLVTKPPKPLISVVGVDGVIERLSGETWGSIITPQYLLYTRLLVHSSLAQ